MDSKYIKIQSVQGGPFTDSQNLVDFRIPSSGVYDLADSYINLLCSVDVTEPAAQVAAGGGIYNFNGKWKVTTDTDRIHFQNVALVRNANMNTSRQGRIENLRRVDILRDNLATYTKSQMEDLNESYLDVSNFESPVNSQAYGIFTQINKTGLVKSRYNRQTPISIKLSDIFEFCRVRAYDTDKTGDTHIHLELNRDRLQLQQIGLSEGAQGRVFPNEILGFCNSQAGSPVANSTLIVCAAPANVGNVTDPTVFTSLDQSPYYVGQCLKLTVGDASGIAAPAADTPVVISSIVWDKDGIDPYAAAQGAPKGCLVIRFEQPFGTALTGAQQYGNITAKIAEPTTATLNLDAAELVLRHKANAQVPAQVQYNTYSTEETNGNSLVNFTNLYTVEPEATNVVIMFPDGEDNLVSNNNFIEKWRLRLNQEDLTDRSVERGSPLAFDRLAMTFNSMGTGLSNLTRNTGKTNAQTWPGTYTDTKFDSVLIANPLFQTQQQKLLQVNIDCADGSTGVRQLVLYKQLPRVFSY